MAYLLNPLLQEYEYNDIANDFMGITVEGRSDIIGKIRSLHILQTDLIRL